MIAALIGAGTALLGGALQSRAADKAKDAQEAALQRQMQAQQRAAGEVRQLNQPGVNAYGTALNALGNRLGLPTQGVAGTQQQAAFDPAGYLAANPDVMAEYQRLSPENLRNNLGVNSPEEFATWHRNQYGQFEPGRNMGGAQPQTLPTSAGPAPTQNALGPPAGSFGNVQNPTYTDPGNYQAPTYTAPDAFSFDLASFQNNPAYQMALETGSGQVMANASATGALQSGAALKALQDRGQKTAYQFYAPERDAAYTRYNTDRNFGRDVFSQDRDFGANQADLNRRWGRGLYESDRGYLTGRYDTETGNMFRYLGVGQDAVNATGNAALGEGNALSSGFGAIGDAQAGNALQQGNIWSGVLGNVGGAVAGLVNGRPRRNALAAG